MPQKSKAELCNENESLKRKIKRLEKKVLELTSVSDYHSSKSVQGFSEFWVLENNTHIAIARIDLNNKIIFANKKYETVLGLPGKEIIGRHLVEVLGEDNFAYAKNYLEVVKKGNEVSYINKFNFNGNPIWAKVNYIPEISGGSVKGITVLAYDITEAKVAEMELQNNESLLKKVQKVARLGSYVFDTIKGEWTSSETLDEIFGIDENFEKDIEGWIKVVHPEDKENMFNYLLNHVVKDKNRFEKEYRIIRFNDRQVRWVYGMGELEFDAIGNTVKMIGTIQDITDRKVAELSLAESEELHKKLLSTLPDLILRTNLKGDIVFANDQVFAESGLGSGKELLGSNIFNFLAKDDKERALENTRQMFEQKLGPREYKLTFSNGRHIDCEVNGDVLRNVEGQPFGMVYSLRNITERNKTNEALKESEIRYRELIEFAADGILLGSNEGKIIGANSYMLRLTGRSLKELQNSSVTILFDPKELENIPLRYDLLLKGEIVRSERNIVRPDGSRIPIEMQTKMMPNGTYQAIFRDITERKMAEEAIRESTEKYRALSEASLDAVFISENGICLEQNTTARQMFGYSDEEIVGKRLTDFITQEYRDLGNSNIRNHIEDTYEIKVIKNGGTIIPAMVRAKMMSYKGKRVRFTSLTDITERKKSEELLRISEMYLSKAEEVARIGNWVFNLKDDMIRASEGAKQIYGVNTSELPLGEVKKFTLGEYRQVLDEAMKNLIEKGSKYDVEFKVKRPMDGMIVDVRSKAEFDSKTMTVFGVVQDVTEQKMTESLIRERERFLDALVQNLPAMVFVKDARTLTYVSFNKAGEKLLGYTLDELKGKTDFEVYPYELARFFSETDKRVLQHKKLEDIQEEEIFTKDGKRRILNTKKIPLLDSEGNPQYILGIAQDITERFVFEKELLKAKEEAEKSERLKSEFLAQMSHEIRSPISTILNFVSLIKMKLSETVDDELLLCFGGIDSSSKRVIRTIDMILNMSEIQSGTYENKPVKLELMKQVFESLYKEFKVIAERKGLELIIHKPEKDITLTADEYSATQIFANLIDNAIKYTHEGKVEVMVIENGRYVTVNVKDTGIGISEEYIPHLFEAFSQEEQGYTRNFEGNGLGLALVKKYCEMNDAEISVESYKGIGTTFNVIFKKNNHVSG